MNLNLYEDHFSYFNDMEKYTTVSCVPSVIDYGRPDGSYTAMNGPVPEMSSTRILVECTIPSRPYSTA
jgi:hypothetical protein